MLAAPVFASSVVAIPLMLDRRIGVLGAVLTSWRAVMQSPGPMALWGALLMAITLLGMAPLLLGLIVAVPWLAHASWHAYRDLVDTSAADRAARLTARLMFGYSEDQIAQFGLTFGVSAFMLYMVFIIFQLARESKAGKLRHLRAVPGAGLRPAGLCRQGGDQVLHRRRRMKKRRPRPALHRSRARAQPMCRPPLQLKSAPVVKPESSPASQATIEPISSGVPRRLTGMVATIFSSTSGLIARTMSVPM